MLLLILSCLCVADLHCVTQSLLAPNFYSPWNQALPPRVAPAQPLKMHWMIPLLSILRIQVSVLIGSWPVLNLPPLVTLNNIGTWFSILCILWTLCTDAPLKLDTIFLFLSFSSYFLFSWASYYFMHLLLIILNAIIMCHRILCIFFRIFVLLMYNNKRFSDLDFLLFFSLGILSFLEDNATYFT